MAFNIVVYSGCRFGCAFCFAREVLAADEAIAVSDFSTVLRFLKRGGVARATLLGGEPTQHPRFDELIRIAADARMSLLLLTSGRWEHGVTEVLGKLPAGFVSYCVNLDSHLRRDGAVSTSASVREIADAEITWSITVDSPRFDFASTLAGLESVGAQAVRWSFALPSAATRGNQFLPIEDYPRVAEELVAFLVLLRTRGIRVHSDHLVPLCAFSACQLRTLATHGIKLATRCQPVVDILPDLTAIHCLPLGRAVPPVRLADFETPQLLRSGLERLALPLRTRLTPGECAACHLFSRGLCTGGCLGCRLVEAADSAGTAAR